MEDLSKIVIEIPDSFGTKTYLLVHDNGDGTFRQMGVEESFRPGETLNAKTTWKDPVKAYKSFAPCCLLCMFELSSGSSSTEKTVKFANGHFSSADGEVWIVNGRRSRPPTEGPALISLNPKGYLTKDLKRTNTVRYEHYFENDKLVLSPEGFSTVSFDRQGKVVNSFDWRNKRK